MAETIEAITFTFDGRRFSARPGDTIASALYRAGVRTFSRSFKYHRPRGLLCVAGNCPNCLVNADGVPNVRACREPVRMGMVVAHQNAVPSLENDFLSLTESLDEFMPVGFYYKRFHRPKGAWPLAEKVIRPLAGLGVVDTRLERGEHSETLNLHAEVVVIGGGPSGLAAAAEAARSGQRVVLVDENEDLGGHLRYQSGATSGPEVNLGRQLAEQVRAAENVTVLSRATAFGLYDSNLVAIEQDDNLLRLRPSRLVFATGSHEYLVPFHNNDLPGVLLGSGAQRLVNLHGVKVGQRAAIACNNDYGYTVARDLLAAGLEVVALADVRQGADVDAGLVQALSSNGSRVLLGHTLREARGREYLEGATFVSTAKGAEVSVDCDTLCLSFGFAPASALLHQTGCKFVFDERAQAFVPATLATNLYAAGGVNGDSLLDESVLEGRIAGLQAASSLRGVSASALEEINTELAVQRQRLIETQQAVKPSAASPMSASGGGKKRFVCVCEDITEKDLCQAVVEGFSDIETLKRYSTAGMGPCQGKMCACSVMEILSRETNRSLTETGTTTARPPYVPVSFRTLAGPSFQPVKRTPMHHSHENLGAKMIDLGGWERPELYSTVKDEYRAVRERAGLIDVSTLGKIDLRGKDVVKLLEKVYTNKWSDLQVGRIRYGLMCDEGGIVFDDGTCGRLAEDHYFLTTTTGNAETVYQWLDWWLVGTGWDVYVTNVTSCYAAINLAGPDARRILSRLTESDVSNAALPYMGLAEMVVAGVLCRLLRIGFVGEVGYEIHFPSEYGEHVWKAVMAAGADFGARPFGVETQRVLRLEKKHIIVGQDTDANSNPLEAGMSWAVKLDKPDFVGRRALVAAQERGPRQSLVGFRAVGSKAVPPEGCQIVKEGRSVGRITSARLSPSTGIGIALGWVPVDQSGEGTEVSARVEGRDRKLQVTHRPFYDPEGMRLRS